MIVYRYSSDWATNRESRGRLRWWIIAADDSILLSAQHYRGKLFTIALNLYCNLGSMYYFYTRPAKLKTWNILQCFQERSIWKLDKPLYLKLVKCKWVARYFTIVVITLSVKLFMIFLFGSSYTLEIPSRLVRKPKSFMLISQVLEYNVDATL